MISKNKIKYLHSLKTKKFRDAEGVFVAEGPKVVSDIFSRYKSNLMLLVGTAEWLKGEGRAIASGRKLRNYRSNGRRAYQSKFSVPSAAGTCRIQDARFSC